MVEARDEDSIVFFAFFSLFLAIPGGRGEVKIEWD